jgi:hypothetical protein
MSRSRLLTTTILSGIVGSAFLTAPAVMADDLSYLNKAPAVPIAAGPAVDGFNEKFGAFGGSIANKSLYGVQGAIGIPLQGQFGAQIDGSLGSLDSSTFGAVGGHLFWRNPEQGLLGIYGSYTGWDRFGGVYVSQIAGEAAYYWGPVTLEGIAGVEFGNSVSSTTTSSSIVPPGIGGIPGLTTTSTYTEGYNVQTRFFDQINLKYYFKNDWSAYVGHRYLGGKNALALGSELAYPFGHGIMGSAFVEARVGEGDFHGVWGGFKLYFGQKDKPLIARQRQDDPPIWTTDTLFSILNNHTTSANSTSTLTCNPPEVPVNGRCQSIVISDVRLKRDIILLDRLASGIGIYRYRYLWSDTLYVGVMAQEVATIVPEAVILAPDGHYRVDYARLGMRLLTWDEWIKAREPIVSARAA